MCNYYCYITNHIMAWITCDENKIVIQVYHNRSQEIINDTGYLPLCIYNRVILMSNGKLYLIKNTRGIDYILLELVLGTTYNHHDYVIDLADFTDTYTKINSEYYEITTSASLYKIPVVAKNSYNIIKVWCRLGYCYYYVDVNDDLIFFCERDESHTILDSNVNTIYYHPEKIIFVDYIIYKKDDNIICSAYNCSKIIATSTINYCGSPIVKMLDKFVLDSDNNLYVFIFDNDKHTIKKVLDNVIDFNVCDTKLYIIDSTYKIYNINTNNYSKTYVDRGGFLKKNVINTKSANKL